MKRRGLQASLRSESYFVCIFIIFINIHVIIAPKTLKLFPPIRAAEDCVKMCSFSSNSVLKQNCNLRQAAVGRLVREQTHEPPHELSADAESSPLAVAMSAAAVCLKPTKEG